MAAAPLPAIIVLALGSAALGGPDALRVLLEFTGRSPCLDIAICMFLMIVVTAYLLGAVLLVRFVRDARPRDGAGSGGGDQGHGATASVTDCIAQVSLLVSVCVGFLVAACLIALPPSVPYLSGKNSFVAVAVVVMAAAAVRCTSRRLLRLVRGAGNAGDAALSALTASERFTRTRQTMYIIFVALLLAAASSAAAGGLDARRIFPGFPFGVAIATVAGTALVVRFSRRVRNAAGAATARSTPLAGVIAVAYAHSQSGSESDGGEHANSA